MPWSSCHMGCGKPLLPVVAVGCSLSGWPVSASGCNVTWRKCRSPVGEDPRNALWDMSNIWDYNSTFGCTWEVRDRVRPRGDLPDFSCQLHGVPIFVEGPTDVPLLCILVSYWCADPVCHYEEGLAHYNLVCQGMVAAIVHISVSVGFTVVGNELTVAVKSWCPEMGVSHPPTFQ